jgi:prepilin-type N-terminal cleavage/methylation domain-containing protein
MSKYTGQNGFSLIELMVAMAILLIGTLAVASMLMTSSTNSIYANQSRGGDNKALEIVEALKGQISQYAPGQGIGMLGLDRSGSCALKLNQILPGYTSATSPGDLYQDATTQPQFGVPTNFPAGYYVEQKGTGPYSGTNNLRHSTYIYSWKLSNISSDCNMPTNTLLLEVTVGWNDKNYGTNGTKYPCGDSSLPGYTGYPGDPGDPHRTCARCAKITNWVMCP